MRNKNGAPLRVSQVAISRFHHFHLARQLEKRGLLEFIFTGYPKFKLRNEEGIPRNKIRTFPWIHAPYMARYRFSTSRSWLSRQWSWWARQSLDRFTTSNLGDSNVLIGLSGYGLQAGRKIQSAGGVFICDRGSAHIRFQEEVLRREYERWEIPFAGFDPRVIAKEESEYEAADRLIVPSEFARKTYLSQGVPEGKICKIPYGVQLDRFVPKEVPPSDDFLVLYVGAVSIRKGFLHLLDAFRKFRHPRKRMIVVGSVDQALRPMIAKLGVGGVTFQSYIPNDQLPELYRRASACVLPSMEDGFGMVVSEALACGCPVIASENVGGSELITHGQNGFVIPAGDAVAIVQSLEWLADNAKGRKTGTLSIPSGGWDVYGDAICAVLVDATDGRGQVN